MKSPRKPSFTLGLAASLLQAFILPFFAPALIAQDLQTSAPLAVTVVQGEGITNQPRRSQPQQLIVRIESADGQPVPRALVMFAAPDTGAGGAFLDGLKSLQVTTDQSGIAVANGFRPNSVQGSFAVKITALSQGRSGYATIHQTNAVSHSAALGLSRRTWWIVGAVVVAGAAGGAVVATRHGSSSSGTTITSGGVTIGAPH